MISYENIPTSKHAVTIFNQKRPTAPLRANYQALLMAPVATVFEAVANHEQYCQFMPNLKQATVSRSVQGLIRTCDFGNDMILQERIVLWQPPAAYAYAAIAPNPFGVWDHLAVVTCDSCENGTQLRWQHYFDHDDLTAMLSMLNHTFDQMFAKLFAQFDGHTL